MKTKTKKYSIISLLSMLLLAASFSDQSFEESVYNAPIIAKGAVGNAYSNWVESPENGKKIYTFYELQVDEILKGESTTEPTLIFRQLGGEKDGVGLSIPGSAQFKRGESVVIYLGPKNDDGSYDLKGMMMGKYEVNLDENGNEVLSGGRIDLYQDHAAHSDTSDTDAVLLPQSNEPKKWTITDLKTLIKSQKNTTKSTSIFTNSPTPSPENSPQASSLQRSTNSGGEETKNDTISPDSDSPEKSARSNFPTKWILITLTALGVLFLFKKRK